MCSHTDQRPLQYNSLFLITHLPPLETSASQTSQLIIYVCGTRSQTILEVQGETTHALFTAHMLSVGSLLSFGPVRLTCTCSTFSMLSKKIVFLSATVQCKEGDSTRSSLRCNACRKCCFDVYKLLTSNRDIDRPPASILEHIRTVVMRNNEWNDLMAIPSRKIELVKGGTSMRAHVYA